MTSILPWLLLPLGMMAAVFGFECLVNGVDLSIQREGDQVTVSATNIAGSCVRFEYNDGLDPNGWRHFRTLLGEPGDIAADHISFRVKATTERAFWRLRDCANP